MNDNSNPVTSEKLLREFDLAILKWNGQIRVRVAVTAINFSFPLQSIVVLNNENGRM